jgi:hypothetical protein
VSNQAMRPEPSLDCPRHLRALKATVEYVRYGSNENVEERRSLTVDIDAVDLIYDLISFSGTWY